MKPLGIKLDRDIAEVAESAYLRYLRRVLKDRAKALVSYRIRGNGRWCLGVWRNRLDGRVQEILSYAHPSELRPQHLNLVIYFLNTTQRLADNLAYRNRLLSKARSEDAIRRAADRERAARIVCADKKKTIHRRANPYLAGVYGAKI